MADKVDQINSATEGKLSPLQQEASELHQHFGVFNIRCAFVLEALANQSFDQRIETLSPGALGAMCYVGELLEDLTELQEKFDQFHQRMKRPSE